MDCTWAAVCTTGRSRLSPDPGHPVLELGRGDARSRRSLIVSGSNAEATAWIDSWPDWPVNGLALAGGAGCGKTHLGNVWQVTSEAVVIEPGSLPGLDLGAYIRSPANILIDGIETASSGIIWETAFFHLFNAVREASRSLLLVSRDCPARWAIALPDLKSRLSALPCIPIAPPDDEMLLALFLKLFADRQVRVGPDVLAYIVPRIERSCVTVHRLVDRLDSLALSRQSAITIPLVKAVLHDETNPALPL